MKPWENGPLRVSDNGRYLQNGDQPFFWLGDTGWLIFANLDDDQAFTYLRNRADKGFNVIQAVLVYALPEMQDINKMHVERDDIKSEEYWVHVDHVLQMCDALGLYVALLPAWGSIVKQGFLNLDNVEKYASFLAIRYKNFKNIIWVMGGDIKATGYEKIYEAMAGYLKQYMPDNLMTFHPFGRSCSVDYFPDASWLDFHMFQSGHRRYDQGSLGAWDDHAMAEGYFGEDNWRYVEKCLGLENKPVLDAEPSYEWILQGLHDPSQPYWQARDVRRYAYWSVFAGACGHTYGDNSVIMFYNGQPCGEHEVKYGAKDPWEIAIHHEGSGQMSFLRYLMEAVDFVNGAPRQDLLVDDPGEKYDRVSIFAGNDFLMAYDYTGREVRINTSDYLGADMWYFRPCNGIYSYLGELKDRIYRFTPPEVYNDDKDAVLIIRK